MEDVAWIERFRFDTDIRCKITKEKRKSTSRRQPERKTLSHAGQMITLWILFALWLFGSDTKPLARGVATWLPSKFSSSLVFFYSVYSVLLLSTILPWAMDCRLQHPLRPPLKPSRVSSSGTSATSLKQVRLPQPRPWVLPTRCANLGH